MKTHGYRSRKELDKERSKKEREAGAYQMIRGTSEVVPLDNFGPVHDSFYDNLKVSVTYPFGAGNGNLWAIPEQADGYFTSQDGETFQWEFKTAPRAGAMLHISPTYRSFFDPESVRRAAAGGKSTMVLDLTRELMAEKSVEGFWTQHSVRDVQDRLTATHRELQARKLYAHWMRDPYIAKIANLPMYDTEMSVDLNQMKNWRGSEEPINSEQIIADMMAAIAELPKRPNVAPPIDNLYPHQREIVDALRFDGLLRLPGSIYRPRRTGMSTLFAAAYGRAWHKRNLLTEKLHSMQGDFRPHKVKIEQGNF